MIRFLNSRYGRKGFLLEPDNGNNPVGGNQPADPNNQPQQQNQPQVKSPFEGIDRDLLDSSTREAIEKAERDMADLRGRAAQASTFQSAADTYKAQLEQHQQALQQLQNQQQQNQPNQPNKQLSPIEQLEKDYLDAGLPPENAKQAAKINGVVLTRAFDRYQQQQDQRLAPVIANVVGSNAQEAFTQAFANDQHGHYNDPALRQRLWERTQEIANSGNLVSPDMILNLARIFKMEQLESSGFQQVQQQPSLQQMQNQQFVNAPFVPNSPLQGLPPTVQGTRFSFPGAGIQARAPQQQQSSQTGATNDPDVLAAMGATVSQWGKKPSAYKNLPDPNKVHITRGGL